MADIPVCKENELADGATRIVTLGNLQVAVIRHGSKYFAYRNYCPHQGGPVCEGVRMPRVFDVIDKDGSYKGQSFDKDDIHIICPWHGYAFRLETGEHAGDKQIRLKKYEVVERGGQVYVVV